MGTIQEWVQHIINQLRTILVDPKELFKQTGGSAMTPVQVYLAYILPLALIPTIAIFVGSLVIGFWGVTATFGGALKTALMMYLSVVIGISVLAVILATLSPIYGGERDLGAALTLVAIGYLPAFFVMALWLWPAFGAMATMVGMACVYFVYCGVEVFLKVPQERRVAFVLVSFVTTALVLLFVVQIFGAISAPSVPALPAGMNLPAGVPIPGM